jgi:hypothetical protein
MNDLQHVINLNNNGVILLESNDMAHAVQMFQFGIHFIKQCTNHCSLSTTVKHMSKLQDFSPSSLNVFNENECNRSIIVGKKVQGLQRGIYYTFDRPMFLQSTISSSYSYSDEEFESKIYLVSTILFFNFALASHQYALQCGTSSSLQVAIRMYNTAANFIRDTNFDQCTGNVILCLIMNNMASLHFDLCDFKQCELDLKCIQNSIVDDSYLDVIATQLLDEEEWIRLKLNYFYLHLPTVAQAA